MRKSTKDFVQRLLRKVGGWACAVVMIACLIGAVWGSLRRQAYWFDGRTDRVVGVEIDAGCVAITHMSVMAGAPIRVEPFEDLYWVARRGAPPGEYANLWSIRSTGAWRHCYFDDGRWFTIGTRRFRYQSINFSHAPPQSPGPRGSVMATTTRTVVLPLWGVGAVFGAASIGPFIAGRVRRARARRAAMNLCRQCGYDLRGSAESGRCPECGTTFETVRPSAPD